MQFRITSLAAALALLSGNTQAHLIMKSPVPYSHDTIDNSPLTSSNYPCKSTGDASFYSTQGIDNTMAIGEPQTLSFIGSAVHGGGSCQLALTKDMAPTASTSWEVILSIEGGCPSKGGSGPSEYEFKIPDGIAPGKYSFAWTWISKLSGTQEYYMNCAPVTITGGSSSKRTAADQETGAMVSPRAGSFPELFVGNLPGINSCKSTLSTDPKYPDPGSNVEHFGSPDYGKITGSNCVPKGQTEGGGDSGGDSSSSSAGPAPTSSSAPSSTAAPTPTPTTFKTSTTSAGTPPASSSAAPTSAPSGGKTGACTQEGTFNCDGSSYQQCAAGQWTSMQSLPGGTKCVQGESSGLWA